MKTVIGYVNKESLQAFPTIAFSVVGYAERTSDPVRVEVVELSGGAYSYEYAQRKTAEIREELLDLSDTNTAQILRMLARALEKGPDNEN